MSKMHAHQALKEMFERMWRLYLVSGFRSSELFGNWTYMYITN